MTDVRFPIINPTSPPWQARAAGRPGGRAPSASQDVEPVEFDAEADLVGISRIRVRTHGGIAAAT